MSDDHFLARWSRLKKASKSAGERAAEPTPGEGRAAAALPASAAAAPPAPTPAAAQPLPPVESLTPESDFTAFMREGVDPSLRRRALQTLFRDPRFNVMDGLDVYIDDYSKPDPLPAGWLEKLNQTARLGEYREPDEKAPEPAVADEVSAPAVVGEIPEQEQEVEATAQDAAEAPDEQPENEGTSPRRP